MTRHASAAPDSERTLGSSDAEGHRGRIDPTGSAFGGRYTLIRRLAVGGMAEIYLARQAAMAGFEKEVVIKRLRHELADDPRVVEMFLDEARIGALLNHPNIVHVYDVDEQDGIPYIAMEYILGEELNELCRRGLSHAKFLPLEHAVELMRQAAAGMGYFHAMRGPEGMPLADQPLDIVHLDISPSNLLVTRDGFLKVIDFGIANAKGQRTRSDVIPGKLGYMSPEQAARRAVDHRSDIFSLGIVMYEITVGKRLFRGPAQDVIQRITTAQIEPPTFARRNFPSALEAIVLRALELHPEDRYQSAYDLADDLESFLRDERMHSGPVRIARYLDNLAVAGGGTHRPELVSEDPPKPPGEELDFDSAVFQSFAPGPEQAKEWEEEDQPEQEVAAALGMGLEELRALRTPVPGASSKFEKVDANEAAEPAAPAPAPKAESKPVPTPVEEPDPSEKLIAKPIVDLAQLASESDVHNRVTLDMRKDRPAKARAATDAPTLVPPGDATVKPASVPTDAVPGAAPPERSGRGRRTATPRPVGTGPDGRRGELDGAVVAEAPMIGSRMIEKQKGNPAWFLVILLALAVAGLVAYIVMQ